MCGLTTEAGEGGKSSLLYEWTNCPFIMQQDALSFLGDHNIRTSQLSVLNFDHLWDGDWWPFEKFHEKCVREDKNC